MPLHIFHFRPARLVFAGLLFLMAAGPARAETSPGPAPIPEDRPDNIQKTIALLEDDQRRREVITLLKLMAALESQRSAPADPAQPEEAAGPDQPRPGLSGYLQSLVRETWLDLSSAGAGVKRAGQEAKAVFKALTDPLALALWYPYLLKTCLWGLACLLATWLILRCYGRKLPESAPPHTWLHQARALIKYVLVVAGPNLVLILSLLALPPLPATAPGVTADMALGFSLIRALIQYFFVNLSILYISLTVAAALFSPAGGRPALADLRPALASHFLRSWRFVAVYLAVFVLLDQTFLSHFASGRLYALALVLMTAPLPLYLTFRLIKLRHLTSLIDRAENLQVRSESAEDQANSEETAEPPAGPPPPYQGYLADLIVKKHWALLAILIIWGLTLIFLFNPAGARESLTGNLAVTLGLAGVAALLVKASRLLMRRLGAAGETPDSRRLRQNADNLVNLVVWSALGLGVLVIWGLPLGHIIENKITRELLGRSLTITVTIAALTIFIRFSRLVTEWLLSVPNIGQNRNWRTMTPLALTAVRAMAVFVGVVVILERLGVNVGPILAGAGILGLGVGMGAQSLVKDVINGISILLMDTLAVGDYVTIGGRSGTVESLGLRTIRLRDVAGNLTVVPNSSVEVIVNMTKDYSRDIVEFTAPYDADPDQMLKLAGEVARELSQAPAWRPRLTSPINLLGVTSFDANGTTIRLRVNTSPGQQWEVGRELRLRLKRRMLADGYKSPWFGQNVTIFRGPETGPPPADDAP
ncbi:MAG: mechanosensitive ion channel family protein [Candidatus Adiutrix sp.]|jgi:small conductance mechanosensitive channel|nr:mechanosensitive ion channel family protein [Candidatus Adiutrix sp.]